MLKRYSWVRAPLTRTPLLYGRWSREPEHGHRRSGSRDMTARACASRHSFFAVIAVLQFTRAVVGWPVTVGATVPIPCGQVGLLAWLPLSLPGLASGHRADRGASLELLSGGIGVRFLVSMVRGEQLHL
jgi:hypothetical protein